MHAMHDVPWVIRWWCSPTKTRRTRRKCRTWQFVAILWWWRNSLVELRKGIHHARRRIASGGGGRTITKHQSTMTATSAVVYIAEPCASVAFYQWCCRALRLLCWLVHPKCNSNTCISLHINNDNRNNSKQHVCHAMLHSDVVWSAWCFFSGTVNIAITSIAEQSPSQSRALRRL